MSTVVVALVHHPVVDREGSVITTAITNLDLHDMARTIRTYDLSAFYVIHPVAAQRELAQRVRDHWVGGSGARRIPTREPAMQLVKVVSSMADMFAELGGRGSVDVYATSAGTQGRIPLAHDEGRDRLAGATRPSVLLFGTGWGLAPAVVAEADVLLAPIWGRGACPYNHLSVRAACAILLDRLFGARSE